MRVDDDPAEFFETLKTMLLSTSLPVQTVIAQEVGVHQTLVSRAQTGKLKRITESVRRLGDYASSRVKAEERAAAAAASIERDEDVPLTPTSETLVTAKNVRSKPPAAAIQDRPDHAGDALRDIKAYLEDGYDPRLIVEQLVVLRRAQRVRRPGRVGVHPDA